MGSVQVGAGSRMWILSLTGALHRMLEPGHPEPQLSDLTALGKGDTKSLSKPR